MSTITDSIQHCMEVLASVVRKEREKKVKELTLVLFFFFFGGVAPEAYGGSQARGPIGATATRPRHSHSNAGSKLCLRSAPQLVAMPVP